MKVKTLAACAAMALLVMGCGQKAQPRTPVPVAIPSAPPEHQVAYLEGLQAFREATPDGFLRATVAFRKATDLKKDSCEYALHLGESLLFLAEAQKNNWEEFRSQVGEANAVLFFKQGAPECNAFDSYLTRLRVLSMAFEGVRLSDVGAMIRSAIRIDPEDVMNWVVLSHINPDPSRGDPRSPAQRAEELVADLPIVQYELGNYFLRNQETFAKARVAFERVLEVSPRHFKALVGIVYSLSTEGDAAADRVLPLLHRAVELGPTSLSTRTLLGEYYAGLEETDRAVEHYKTAIAQNPAYYPAHLGQGTTLATADRPDEAEASFNAVIALEVQNPHPPHNGVDFTANGLAHYYLGNIWLERNNLVKARAEYNEALSSIFNYPAAIYGIGIVSYREGMVDEALVKLNQVIELEPRRFPNAYLARGGIRAERRQFARALPDFNLAVEIYRQQIVSIKARAKTDEEKGRHLRVAGHRRRQALLESALEKALESKRVTELQVPGGEK